MRLLDGPQPASRRRTATRSSASDLLRNAAGPGDHRRPAQRREHHRLPAPPTRSITLPQQRRRARRATTQPRADRRGAVRRGAPRWSPGTTSGSSCSDFLPRIVGDGARRRRSCRPARPAAARRFFDPRDDPFIPVEFSGAAYRFGHTMVRPAYDLNDIVTGRAAVLGRQPTPTGHLRPPQRVPPAAGSVDHRLDPLRRRSTAPARSSRAGSTPHLAQPLLKLPGLRRRRRNTGLPVLNLRRGKALQLPSGQAIAQAHRRDAGRATSGSTGFGLLRRAPRRARGRHAALVLRAARGRERAAQRPAARPGRRPDRRRGARRPARARPQRLPAPAARLEAARGCAANKAGHFTLGDLLRFATR